MKGSRLVILALNEINFDLVRRYMEHRPLPGFRQLLEQFAGVETFAETNYQDLEPWIQWVSAHTGKTYEEHRVFRLGDIVHSDAPQLFEQLESRGLKIGAISPMNCRNELKQPAYFIPDPWTLTSTDGSAFSERLTAMLRQTVNDNAQGSISKDSLRTLAAAVAKTFDFTLTPRLFSLVARSISKPWLRSLVLDQLIHTVHMHLLRKHRPDVSYVFMNAGAHIQHHYFFSSPYSGVETKNPAWYVSPEADPIGDMLSVYDKIVQDYLKLTQQGCRLFVATGLTQVPYNRAKFYYRLKQHGAFLDTLGIRYQEVHPRMTRDFEIVFPDVAAARQAIEKLGVVRMEADGVPLFSEIEDRGTSAFVSLTYPTEIQPGMRVLHEGGVIDDLSDHVAFVAIKNGMHSGKGFAFASPNIKIDTPREPIHVAKLRDLISEAATN